MLTIALKQTVTLDEIEGLIILAHDTTGYDELDPFLSLEAYEKLVLPLSVNDTFVRVSLIDTKDKDEAEIIDAMANAMRTLKHTKVKKLAIDTRPYIGHALHIKRMNQRITECAYLVANEGWDMKSKSKSEQLSEVYVISPEMSDAGFKEATILAEMTQRARELINLPANIMTPTELALQATLLGQQKGFEVEVLDEKHIEALKMNAFLTVARGSVEPPKLIIMRYEGAPEDTRRVGLIGKGLTYDSGGYSIKPTSSMLSMKDDMSGAAAVITAMGAIAAQKLKMNVVGVVAACENMISGTAYRPGDIVESMAGKTIFIGNTDAEGRLTLVDALHYAIEFGKADMLVDIATLTGAARHCLGDVASPIVTNDAVLCDLTINAFGKSGEKLWQMPNDKAYHKLVKHSEADLTNSAGQPGVMTAGAFLEAFVQEKPWVHIDIGATAYMTKAQGERPAGGTGFGVRGLYHVVKKLSK